MPGLVWSIGAAMVARRLHRAAGAVDAHRFEQVARVVAALDSQHGGLGTGSVGGGTEGPCAPLDQLRQELGPARLGFRDADVNAEQVTWLAIQSADCCVAVTSA